MVVADNALGFNAPLAVKSGLRKPLPPGTGGFQHTGVIEGDLGRIQLAIHPAFRLQALRVTEPVHSPLQPQLQLVIPPGGNGQPRRHGMPAEGVKQIRHLLGDPVQPVAQVKTRNGAPRPFQPTVPGGRKGDHGPVCLVLDARRQNADDALVPVRTKKHMG